MVVMHQIANPVCRITAGHSPIPVSPAPKNE